MGASNGWKCQQEKGISDERELVQHLQQHLVAGRRGRSGRCLFQLWPYFQLLLRKLPRNRECKGISGSTASKGASGSRGSIGG